jgi:hypothetical protein
MPELVLTAGFADVEVVRPRPFGRLGEEVEVRRCGVRHEEVAKPLERSDIALARLDGRDRQLKVEDGLRGDAGDRSGPDVFQADRNIPEGLGDETQLVVGLSGPTRVVLDDADGGIEALVQRWVALEAYGRSPACRSAPRASSESRRTSSPAGTSAASVWACPAHRLKPSASSRSRAAARTGAVRWWTSG